MSKSKRKSKKPVAKKASKQKAKKAKAKKARAKRKKRKEFKRVAGLLFDAALVAAVGFLYVHLFI